MQIYIPLNYLQRRVIQTRQLRTINREEIYSAEILQPQKIVKKYFTIKIYNSSLCPARCMISAQLTSQNTLKEENFTLLGNSFSFHGTKMVMNVKIAEILCESWRLLDYNCKATILAYVLFER